MNIIEEVKGAGTIGICGHARPDGDCIGAAMGLFLYLEKACPDARIEVFMEKPADIFNCIRGIHEIHTDFQTDVERFDVFIALDVSGERLEQAATYFREAGKRINIDHHISNPGCGDVNYILPEASSTCELIYRVAEDKTLIDASIAEALYIGMMHDTGVFQYSNTSPDTLRIVAELISYGFDFPALIDKTFYERTYVQNQILGRALLESFLFMDGRCIVSRIDRKTMDFYQAKPYDLEGIASQLRNTAGVECAIFMYELDAGEYKVSLRSNGKVNVAEVASHYGGGGHVRAAGVTMQGNFYEVLGDLSDQIILQLE